MNLRRALIGLVTLAGCAATPVDVTPPSSGALALHAEKSVPADISASFAREIAARYGADRGAESVRNDLMAQGFQCADAGANPDVKVGEVYAACELPRPHGLCSDKWIVDLRLKRLVRAVDFARVAAEGRFERFCIAGASPNG